MKQVSITLEPEIASAYLKANSREQKKAQTLVNLWLKDLFVKKTDTRKELFELMQTAGKIAQVNGLTPEKLEEILQEIKNEKQ